MKTHRMTWIAILAVAVALSWLAVAGAQNQVKKKANASAVCDVQKAFDALAEWDQVQADLRVQTEKLKLEGEEKQKKIRELQADLEILAKDSAAWKKKKSELDNALIELQVWQQVQNNNLQQERGLQIENLYRKMIDAAGRVARTNGFDVVLYKEPPVRFTGAKPEQIPAIISSRKVLWAADELDLTDQVVVEMNNDFKNNPKGK